MQQYRVRRRLRRRRVLQQLQRDMQVGLLESRERRVHNRRFKPILVKRGVGWGRDDLDLFCWYYERNLCFVVWAVQGSRMGKHMGFAGS